ncbi:MAG TPA: phosphoribosylamine--glycine ligase [Candidatus Eisenbacteria bacterium]|uniref:Phosphoribosylamine--glycine ligase n=1 Tax=Eiseniibacteriota bacterium TaxID=2212470 RepID=A0A7V2ATC5_UNCEI|nr:phosphoribosylamine--glycine ligase [Candidatus Eisenbacteria bacterium]
MKVLVIGGGGREHTLVWKIAQSQNVEKIYAAPGNAGIAELAECVPVGADRYEALLSFADERDIDLTVVGPEAPLVGGIVDLFAAKGRRIFGFDSSGARLEGSKVFAKEFMRRHGVPTGGFEVYERQKDLLEAIERGEPPYVLKADGLAAGKGVVIAESKREALVAAARIMKERVFGSAGDRVVLEEFLEGPEISILALFDGESYRLFAPSQDHKRAFDGDGGPNTGGMGAYAPVPAADAAFLERVRAEIAEPTFEGMRKEGFGGAGVLYFGLILSGDGPRVLEYNCRFGDPETQVILPLFAGDLAEAMFAATERRLGEVFFENSPDSAACIVIASGGYPGDYEKGYPIEGLDEARKRGCIVFHAGTKIDGGRVVTAGGRVLGVTAVDRSLEGALDRAYDGVAAIRFEKAFHRTDIGRKGLERARDGI